MRELIGKSSKIFKGNNMKKIKMILVIMLVSLSVTGCDNSIESEKPTKNDKSIEAEESIEEGKESLENHEYDKALSHFERASSQGSKDKEMEDLITTIEIYNGSLKLFEKEEFENAKKELAKIEMDYSKYSISRDIDNLNESVDEKLALLKKDHIELQQKETRENIERKIKEAENNIAGKSKEIKVGKINIKDKYLDKIIETNREEEELYNEVDNSKDNYNPVEIPEQVYKLWDDLLNEIWDVLEDNLPKDEMDKLTEEQRQWIKVKEDMEQRNYEDGLSTTTYLGKMTEITKKRSSELVENYMD